MEYLFQSADRRSSALKLWLIHPISSLSSLLFRSSPSLLLDREFLLMSIESGRLNELFSINPSLLDFYLGDQLSNEEKQPVLDQLEENDELLFPRAQLILQRENYSSFTSFNLILQTIENELLQQ